MIDTEYIYLKAGTVASSCVLTATNGVSLLTMAPGKLLGSLYFKFCRTYLPTKQVIILRQKSFCGLKMADSTTKLSSTLSFKLVFKLRITGLSLLVIIFQLEFHF